MVKTSLVDADLTAGLRLLKELRSEPYRSSFRVKAAFWFFYLEAEEWRLVIATPLVDEAGTLETYRQLQHVLGKTVWESDIADFTLQNLAVISPRDALAKAINAAKPAISPRLDYVRVAKSFLKDRYIEAAYVYRING